MAGLLLDRHIRERLALLLEGQAGELVAREWLAAALGRGRPHLLGGRATRRHGGGGGGAAISLLGRARGGTLLDQLIHILRIIHAAGPHERARLVSPHD